MRQNGHTGPEKLGCTLTAGISSDSCQQQSSAPTGGSRNFFRYHCKGWLSCSSRRLKRTPDSVKDSIATHGSSSPGSPAPGALVPDCALRMKTISLLTQIGKPLASRQRVCVTLIGLLLSPRAPFLARNLTSGRVWSAWLLGQAGRPVSHGQVLLLHPTLAPTRWLVFGLRVTQRGCGGTPPPGQCGQPLRDAS